MKKFDLKGVRGVLSSLRGGPEKSQPRVELEVTEPLQPHDFQYGKLMRHGFPYHPTSLAWDPVQRLLAIGTRHGAVRLLGQPSVDYQVQHESDVVVLQIVFLINEGAFITACSDNSIHLWNFRQKIPEIVHSIKFNRESLTCLHLPFQSKWLYVGTERGNVHIVNIESFTLSGYTINWNKAIDLSQKAHPGPVIHLSDNPVEPSKLLIGFETGYLVLWDLKNKDVEFRYYSSEPLRDVDWHHEGRQFMSSHTDGSLAIWNYRSPSKPASIIVPHQKASSSSGCAVKDPATGSSKPPPCKPITRLRWLDMKEGEPYILFTGGLSSDRPGKTPSLTLMHGKNVTVLELDHTVVDFAVLCNSIWAHECEDPYAVIVLLSNDLIMVDLTSMGYPCFENPYSMDVHESPVTCLRYFSDCASSLVPALYSCGTKQRKKGFSDKEFPISGGHWGPAASCSYSELLITGHADGSLKFWDSCGVSLQYLYKVSSSKLFEKPKASSGAAVPQAGATLSGSEAGGAAAAATATADSRGKSIIVDVIEDSLAVQQIYLDEESRILATAGPCHVIVYRFSKADSTTSEPEVVHIHTLGMAESDDTVIADDSMPATAPVTHADVSPRWATAAAAAAAAHQADLDVLHASTSVKSGPKKWPAGYQPDMICLLLWSQTEASPVITCLALNSSYNLLAIGTTASIIVIDILQHSCILNVTPASTIYGNGELLSSRPPMPRSSSKKGTASSTAAVATDEVDGSGTQQQRAATAEGTAATPIACSGAAGAGNKTPVTGTSPPDSLSDTCGNHVRDADKTAALPATATGSGHPVAPERHMHRATQQPLQHHQQLLPPGSHRPDEPSASSSAVPHPCAGTPTASSATAAAAMPTGCENGSQARAGEDFERQAVVCTPCATSAPGVAQDSATGAPHGGGVRANAPAAGSGQQQQQEDGDSFKIAAVRQPLGGAAVHNRDCYPPQAPLLQHRSLSRTTSTPVPTSFMSGQRPPHLSSQARGVSDEAWQLSGPDDYVDGEGQYHGSSGCGEESAASSSAATTASDDSPGGGGVGSAQGAAGGKNIIKQVRKLSLKVAAGLSNLNRRRTRTGEAAGGGGGSAACEASPADSPDGSSGGGSGSSGSVRSSQPPPRPDPPRFSSRRDKERLEKSAAESGGGMGSHSYSSSLSSLDAAGMAAGVSEAVQCLVFADTFTRKQDAETCPGLWIGTNSGFVIVMNVNLPGSGEQRLKSPVVLNHSGTVFRMRGCMLDIAFLDCKGLLIPAEAECWKDKAKEGAEVKPEKRLLSRISRQQLLLPTQPVDITADRQIVILVSDIQVRTIALPSQTCMHKVKISDNGSCFAVKADVVMLKDGVCLACLTSTGNLLVYSLPSLRVLHNVSHFSPLDIRVSRTLQFGNHGHVVYMVSPSEIQKITMSSEMCRLAGDMMSDLFVAKETPEPPKQSFFKNLFSVAPSVLDREELFGSQGGKASKGIAQTIPGTAATMQQAQAVTSEIGRARQALNERGEKLGQLDDRTAMMRERAQEFANRAQGLANHYKDKKWYQF